MRSVQTAGADSGGRRLHPSVIRVMHWTNAVAMIVMIMSGWGIYNDEPLFGWLFFPHAIVLGEWAAAHLLWHFAGMWLLAVNGLAYLLYGFGTGRFRERLLPIRPGEVVHDVRKALRLDLAHEDITIYNAVQKLLYIVVILAGALQVVSGLAMWKPVQFDYLVVLFWDFQGARLAHFIGMAIIVGFLVVHVTLAFAVPRTLIAMITGGPRLPRGGARS